MAERRIPRPFSLHWGDGQIVEEAACSGEYHEPAIQLLRFDDGSQAARFCYFDHEGRFQRSPLIVGEDDIGGLADSLRRTPELRAFLQRLLDGASAAGDDPPAGTRR